MPISPTGSETEAEAKRLAKLRRLAFAYREVFGYDEQSRSESQRLVWAEEARLAGFNHTTIRHDHTGRVDPIACAIGEGARQLFLRRIDMIKRTEQPPEVPDA